MDKANPAKSAIGVEIQQAMLRSASCEVRTGQSFTELSAEK